MNVLHIVPVDEEHTTTGLDCWCCPEWYNADPYDAMPLARVEAERLLAAEDSFLVCHRSEVAEANDLTGPIPWLAPRPR